MYRGKFKKMRLIQSFWHQHGKQEKSATNGHENGHLHRPTLGLVCTNTHVLSGPRSSRGKGRDSIDAFTDWKGQKDHSKGHRRLPKSRVLPGSNDVLLQKLRSPTTKLFPEEGLLPPERVRVRARAQVLAFLAFYLNANRMIRVYKRWCMVE